MNPVALVYRTLHPLFVGWWFIRRPNIVAAAAIIERNERVLLIRRTYGNRRLWHLPGGLVNRGEDVGGAAVREVIEETGIVLHGSQFVATFKLNENYRDVTLHIYRGRAVGALKIDPHEIAEAAWFGVHNLPAIGEGTRLALGHRLKEKSS
jgi:ADP-ribose pyrophosphatase YjhB (NUDIX family)